MRRIAVAAMLLILALGACSVVPADPDGTLERVTGGTLLVGVSPNPPWTDLPEGTDGDPAGTEVELVTAFAATLDAEVVWVPGGEEALIGQLERGDLHLVIGGLTAGSPWQEMAGLTRPYTESADDGAQILHVMAVPAGENAFLVTLERFLLEAR